MVQAGWFIIAASKTAAVVGELANSADMRSKGRATKRNEPV
jgi:hypothetical protein